MSKKERVWKQSILMNESRKKLQYSIYFCVCWIATRFEFVCVCVSNQCKQQTCKIMSYANSFVYNGFSNGAHAILSLPHNLHFSRSKVQKISVLWILEHILSVQAFNEWNFNERFKLRIVFDAAVLELLNPSSFEIATTTTKILAKKIMYINIVE